MMRKVDINLITGTFTTFLRAMRTFGRSILFFAKDLKKFVILFLALEGVGAGSNKFRALLVIQ